MPGLDYQLQILLHQNNFFLSGSNIMKINKKIAEQESPVEITRRLRHEYFAKFNYDYKKIYEDVKAEEKKYKNQMIDPKTLPKK